MGPPLSIINEFIYMNVIKPIVKRESDGPTEGCFANKVIPTETLITIKNRNIYCRGIFVPVWSHRRSQCSGVSKL